MDSQAEIIRNFKTILEVIKKKDNGFWYLILNKVLYIQEIQIYTRE